MLKKSVAIFIVGIALTLILAYAMQKMGLLTNIFAQKETDEARENTIINNTLDAEEETEESLTILNADDDSVPLSTDSGGSVHFSDSDILTLSEMLEVPYLYAESFESADGVPACVACHAAAWMAQRKNLNEQAFSQGVITICLFKYFGGTVTDFKENCNTLQNTPINYDKASDTFNIVYNETATHSVEIKEIQFLGNNNYYKVTAGVAAENSSGCPYTSVTAVIQKNKLDSTLGFSVKALQWK